MENQNDTQTLQAQPTEQIARTSEARTTTAELGYLELMRAPEGDEEETADPTDRVLTRPRRSAWDC